MQLFNADVTIFKKKEKIAPENMTNPPSKNSHNRPRPLFYLLAWPGPKTEIPYHQMPFNAGLGF